MRYGLRLILSFPLALHAQQSGTERLSQGVHVPSPTALSASQVQVRKAEILEEWQREERTKLAHNETEKCITQDNLQMPYYYNVHGEKPADGRSLYISMHGGGNAPKSLNDSQWENQKNLYAQLMYEATFGNNAISVGGCINHDYLKQDYLLGGEVNPLIKDAEKETTPGVYTQYTYTLGTKLTAMAGVRWDHSSLYGGFVTPRAHIKYQPVSWFSTRLSAGKGYRTVHALAENHNLLASGRTLLVENLGQEEAWNYGATTAFLIPLGEHVLKLNAEYYYTTFNNQAVIDYDADDSRIWIHDLQGKSRSHVFQVDANYTPVAGLDITAAYRLNDVKCTYGGVLTTKPLTSRYKALLSLSYKLQPLELWQFDATMQLNGGGRLPNDMGTYKAFEQLSAQVTRFFRHFDIYIGGENLTNFKQKNPIINASNPWTSSFEPTLVYGPVEGAMAYMGIRVKL